MALQCSKYLVHEKPLLPVCHGNRRLLVSWIPSLDIFSSSLRVGVFVEAGTDEEVTEDADGTAEVRFFPLSPCCCSAVRLAVGSVTAVA